MGTPSISLAAPLRLESGERDPRQQRASIWGREWCGMNAVQIGALVALLLLFAGVIYVSRRAAAAALPVDPTDPLWTRALERAKATAPQMRGLFETGHEVWVKFPLQVGREREHFWGRIKGAEGLTLSMAVETRPVRGGNVS